MSRDVVEWCDVERLETTTDYIAKKLCCRVANLFLTACGVLRGIHSARSLIKLSPNSKVEMLILYVKHT